MIQISAFADEISADLHEQIAVLRDVAIQYIELRSVWGVNVLDLSETQIGEVAEALHNSGIAVSAIGSPIGKTPIDGPFEEQLRRFERALQLAHTFNTPYIRIFSFYPPASAQEPHDPATYRHEVVRRLRELTARAEAEGIILLHENEKDIYGDTIARCLDLLHSIDSPSFQAILDPANFIQCHQVPYPDAYDALTPWLRYMHVKDALADSTVVAAGEGVARWPELLATLHAAGYDGFFSLEPHLAASGQFQGFSGPDLFRRAAHALQGLLRQAGFVT